MKRCAQVLVAGAVAASGAIAAMTVALADGPVGYSYFVNPNASNPQDMVCVSAGTSMDGHNVSTEISGNGISVQPGVDPYNPNTEPYYGPGGYCDWVAARQ